MASDNLDSLSDEELTPVFAVEVLGMTAGATERKGIPTWETEDGGWSPQHEFNPLTSMSDAWRGVEAHPEWYVELMRGVDPLLNPVWEVWIGGDRDGMNILAEHTNPSVNRALCIALIRAERGSR